MEIKRKKREEFLKAEATKRFKNPLTEAKSELVRRNSFIQASPPLAWASPDQVMESVGMNKENSFNECKHFTEE